MSEMRNRVYADRIAPDCPVDIQSQFLGEALALTLLGGVIGIVLGVIGADQMAT